jgi:predicted transcriptional regulator
MKRTQIYITDEQAAQVKHLAHSRRTSRAHVIRQILDAALDTGDAEAEARAGILATAGILPEAPDWPEWQAAVRGRSAAERLAESGL